MKALVAAAASFVLVAWPAASSAAAEPAPLQIKGWTIARTAQSTCVASGPSTGGASLALAAEGPMFQLVVAAPDFPTGKAPYQVALSFDGKPPVQAVALGDQGVLGINLGRGDPARTVAASHRVSVSVNGRVHEFSLVNAAAALDGVAHCAGVPTLSHQPQEPGRPIQGAPGWTLAQTLAGAPGPACMARMAGDQIDTMLILNNDHDLLLVGGHRDWATWGGQVPLALAIDGGAPVNMTASEVNNLIVVLVKDPALVARLRAAKVLDWTIPTGHVRGEVAGLGAALDEVIRCKAAATGKP